MSRLLTRLAAIFVAVGLFFTSQSLAAPQRAAAADPAATARSDATFRVTN